MRISKRTSSILKALLGIIEIVGSIYLERHFGNMIYLGVGLVVLTATMAILTYITEPEEVLSSDKAAIEEAIKTVAENSKQVGRKIQENAQLKKELEGYRKLAKILNLLVEEGKIPVWKIYRVWEKALKQKDIYLIFEMGDSFPLSKALDESRKRRKVKLSKNARELIISRLKTIGFIPTRSMFSNFITSHMKAIRLFSDKTLRMVPLYVVKFPEELAPSVDKVKQIVVDSYMEYAHKMKEILTSELQEIASGLVGEDQKNIYVLINDIKAWYPANSALLVLPIDTMPIVLGSDKVSSEALFLLAGNERNMEILKEYLKENIFPHLTISIYGKYAGIYPEKVRKIEQQESGVLRKLKISTWSELPIIWEINPEFCIQILEELDVTPEETERLVNAIREIQEVLS